MRSRSRSQDAISPIIGVILILGLIVAGLAIVQTEAVPVWNSEIEFDHHQQVQEDMQNLVDAVYSVASTGSSQSITVNLGTTYPNRIVLRNPPSASGTLRTTPPALVNVSNAEALNNETADYWNGTRYSFFSRGIVYSPDYNYYQNAPTTIYENRFLYNNFTDPHTIIKLQDQSLVNGRRINLLFVNGSYSTSQVEATSVPVQPISSSTTTIAVTNTSSPINITIPSGLNASYWRSILDEEQTANGGHITSISDAGNAGQYNLVNITFEKGVTYNLKMSKIGMGRGFEQEGEYYLTNVQGNNTNLDKGESQKLTVEVRDRYNNPVSGVEINASASNGILDKQSKISGSSGEVSFTYTAPNTQGTYEVEMNISSSPSLRENTTFVVNVGQGGGTTDQQDPSIDSQNAAYRSEQFNCGRGGGKNGDGGDNGNGGRGNCFYMHQASLDFSVSDTGGSGIDYVYVSFNYSGTFNDGYDNVSATTFELEGNNSFSHRYTTPWMHENDVKTTGNGKKLKTGNNAYRFYIKVVDNAGNVATATVTP